MGIEPTRGRANDPSTALKAAAPVSQVVEPQALSENAEPHCTTGCTKPTPKAGGTGDPVVPGCSGSDPDLAAVISSWPELPEAIRVGIVAMVKAASCTTLHGDEGHE